MVTFLFQIGSIKRGVITAGEEGDLGFYSKLVRLKVPIPLARVARGLHGFYSKLVRLKVENLSHLSKRIFGFYSKLVRLKDSA